MVAPTQRLVSKFIDITGTTSDQAISYLSSHTNLELAIDAYLTQQLAAGPSSPELDTIFSTYRDAEGEDIGIDGTIEYIESLGFQPEDVAALILGEFLECPSMGVIGREPFVRKWASVNVRTIAEMTLYIQLAVTRYASDKVYFKKVYEYTFGIALEPKARVLSNEVAVEYWNLLLKPVYGEKVTRWVTFITQEWRKTINRDAWVMLIPFMEWCTEHESLTEYDATAAWPSLMDEFVEWVLETKD